MYWQQQKSYIFANIYSYQILVFNTYFQRKLTINEKRQQAACYTDYCLKKIATQLKITKDKNHSACHTGSEIGIIPRETIFSINKKLTITLFTWMNNTLEGFSSKINKYIEFDKYNEKYGLKVDRVVLLRHLIYLMGA